MRSVIPRTAAHLTRFPKNPNAVLTLKYVKGLVISTTALQKAGMEIAEVLRGPRTLLSFHIAPTHRLNAGNAHRNPRQSSCPSWSPRTTRGLTSVYHERLRGAFDTRDDSCEVIVVGDGSTDNTRPILLQLHKVDARVKAIFFSRNSASPRRTPPKIEAAKGDAIVAMDADGYETRELRPR